MTTNRLRALLFLLFVVAFASTRAQVPTTILNPASDLAGKTLVTAEGNRTISGTFTYSVPALFAAGTTGAPGVVGSVDTTTGFQLSAGQISASLSGVQRFLLSGAGLTLFGTIVVDNTGAISNAALGSGAANNTTFLRGDRTWAAVGRARGCDVRLSLTSGTSVTTADVLAAGSVFVTPAINGGGGPASCAFYDGSAVWTSLPVVEVTITVPAVASQMYDVFCFNNAGTMACDAALAWTNDTTRAVALAKQDGSWVKSGTTTRLYVGSFRTTTVVSQTEDSLAKRYVWSYYNRVPRPMKIIEPTASWAYSLNTWRQTRATATNQLDAIIGVAEVPVTVTAISSASSTIVDNVFTAIGEDSTTTPSANCIFGRVTTAGAGDSGTAISTLTVYPAVGRHTWVWLEQAGAIGTMTWLGTSAGATATQAGITGTIIG